MAPVYQHHELQIINEEQHSQYHGLLHHPDQGQSSHHDIQQLTLRGIDFLIYAMFLQLLRGLSQANKLSNCLDLPVS
ncbi:hypothetical protein D3C78_958800 [compost metagenome]